MYVFCFCQSISKIAFVKCRTSNKIIIMIDNNIFTDKYNLKLAALFSNK